MLSNFSLARGLRGHAVVACQTGDAGESSGGAVGHSRGIICMSQPLHEWLIERSPLPCRILFLFFPP